MSEHALGFGVVPPSDGPATRAAFDALCVELTREAGVPIAPHVFGAPAALVRAIAKRVVHVAWMSPTLFLLSPELATAVPLLSSIREGLAFYHAVLFSDERSRVASLDDLAGKRVAWVAKTSASGYIVPRLSLARRGLDPARLFAKESFLGSHGAAAFAVLEGSADVAATYAVFDHGDARRRLVKSGFLDFVAELPARILDRAGPIPSDLVIAAADVPTHARAVFGSALCALAADPEGSRLVKAVIGADGFRPFSYDAVRELSRLVEAAPGL